MLEFGTNKPLPKFIKLSSGGYMVLRIRPIVLRIHSSKKKEAHEGIYSELLLFLPWKEESELHEDNFLDCENHFKNHEEIIKRNKKAIFPNSPMIDTMMELLETNDALKPTHLSENIDSKAQQDNDEDQEELDELNPLDTSDLPVESEDNQNKEKDKPDGCPYKPIPIPTRDIMFQHARNLSFSQRIVFDKVITYCKSIITAERNGNASSIMDPPLLIVHGGGGVGKSYLIHAIAQWSEKILREGKGRDDPNMPTILLIAYTGVAANNI